MPLLVSLSVSVIPWIYVLAIYWLHPPARELEGDIFVAVFLGVVSFCVTGPLAAVFLGSKVRARTLAFWRFAGIVFAVAAPVLAFEIFLYSGSGLPLILPGVDATAFNMTRAVALNGIVALAWYWAFATAMYRAAMKSSAAAVIVAVLLSAGSLFVFYERLLRS